MIRQAFKEAGILLLIAFAVAFAVYALRSDKIASRPLTSMDDTQQAPDQDGVTEISLADARRLYEADGAIFADARHIADFAAGHIKGAIHLYAADQEVWMSDFLAATDPAATIVTYCDGENCHLAIQLAELLFFNGFDHVFYLKNGWTRWRENGLPVETN